MPLRIAFDLDGVLADMDGALARAAEGLFGEAVRRRPEAVDTTPTPDGEAGPETRTAEVREIIPPLLKLELSSSQTRRLWRHVETIDNFWESLEEIEPGVVARLAGIAAERRWELIFLTRRPETAGDTAQTQTQRWLASKGFALPSVYVVQGSRGRIAAALGLDIVIDDRPENCLDVVVDSRARAILVWREDRSLLPQAAKRLGIGVVATVGECLDILTEIDGAPAERAGMLDRVKKMLGIGATASV